MEYLFFASILFLGFTVRWAMYEHAERRIAAQGYRYYISYSKRWKKKAAECKKRYGYRCAFCYSPRSLETHHRTYLHLFHERQEDLVCLCHDCHGWLSSKVKLYKG